MADDYDAVLIVAFGGPEKPADVMPFIEGVVRGRGVPRQRLVEVASHYDLFGGKSANNDLCRRLVTDLDAELVRQGRSLPVYWGNRNWHPYLAETMGRMTQDGVHRALAFFTSIYSSYSSCRQYLEDIERARAAVGDAAPQVDKLRSAFNHPGFIAPTVDCVAQAMRQVPAERRPEARLVFTAHSLPLAMAEQCAYEAELREVGRLVTEALHLPQWELAFQSRSGPPSQPWLGPDVCQCVRRLRQQEPQARDVVVAPVGFIWDHMEVVYDLDTELRRACEDLGLNMIRAATVGTHPLFVTMVAELIAERLSGAADRPTLGRYGPGPDACSAGCCPVPQLAGRSPARP